MSTLKLDFDGDYGRNYSTTIRRLVAGYDAFFEIASAALQVLAAQASRVLVVGPGRGDELPAMLAALPAATFTLVEPSEPMRERCAAVAAEAGAADRLQWGPHQLDADAGWEHEGFAAVICHNVVHLLPPEQQEALLGQLATRVAPGGVLLISAYSEPNPDDFALWQSIARERFAAQGLDANTTAAVLASRNNSVFSLDPTRLNTALNAAGLEPPKLLMQTLFNRMWFSCKPSTHPASNG